MSLNNKLLNAVEEKIESSLTPETRGNYMKIVVAGMTVAKEGGPNGILASLQKSKDPLSDCVKGAIGLCALMKQHSKGKMPIKAMIPAAMTLMLHALDFADRSGILKVGQPELVKATKMFGDEVFKAVGVSQSMLHTAAGKVHEITQDPAQVAKLKQVSGGEVGAT